MSPTTAKGVPYPLLAEVADVPADLLEQATWMDENPGIKAMTTAQRNALTAPEKWAGRKIWNVTTGVNETWNGAQWVVDGVDLTNYARKDQGNVFTAEQVIERAAANDAALSSRVAGEANPRLRLRPDGLWLGPGGATALDIALARHTGLILKPVDAAGTVLNFYVNRLLMTLLESASDSTRNLRWGSNSPEGNIAAGVGALYLRDNGTAGTVLYVKESGTGNTGWVAVGGRTLIAEQVLGSNTTFVTFSSIPSSFRHLHLVVAGKIDDSGADFAADIFARLNNDSAANYDYQRLSGINATAGASRSLGGTQLAVGRFAKRSVTTVSSLELLISDYNRATFAQAVRGQTGYISTDTTEFYSMAGQWRTAAVVNRIDLFPGSSDPFLAGTVFSLYGLR